MTSNLRPTVKLRRLRKGLLGLLVLIACASLLGASTARAGFFNNLLNQAKKKAVQTIKHDLGNQPTSKSAPATPQPAATSNSPGSQPSGTQPGSVSPASATRTPGPVAAAQKVVGPLLAGATDRINGGHNPYAVSLHGSHLASVHMHGSRYVVTVDGVDGPRVSAVLETYAAFTRGMQSFQPVALSDDGRHYAYVAHVGGKIEVFDDGRKILQFPQHGSISGTPYLVFSPHGGAHLLFADGKFNTEDEELWVDGKPAPAYIVDQGNRPIVTFSADGQHYLYVGTPEDGSSKHVLVVDGKKVAYSVKGIDQNSLVAPRFTADGRHVLCVTNGYIGKSNRKPIGTVLLDGKPVVTAEAIDSLVTAPRGSSFAAVVLNNNVTGSQYTVYLSGTEVPGTRFTPHNDDSIPVAKFSPDGKRLAVACNYGAGNAYVVLDGKKGETYDKIYTDSLGTEHDGMKFSADSQSFGYFAGAGSKTFVVVNGHEYDQAFDGSGSLYFSPEGHHVAVAGETADISGYVVYVDGKHVVTSHTGNTKGTFVFSRDGSHWLVQNVGDNAPLVVDGRPLTFWVLRNDMIFSPDGGELTVEGGRTRNEGGYLYLYNTSTRQLRRLSPDPILGDGSTDASTQGDYNVTFSPDSKHLYYAHPENVRDKQRRQATIYVDGKRTTAQCGYGSGSFASIVLPVSSSPSVKAASPAQKAAIWQVTADDKLHALCSVNNKVVRDTITPPPGGLQ